MNPRRVFFVMLSLVLLSSVALVGVAYGANVLLKKQSQSLVDLKAKNEVLAAEQTELTKAKRDITTYAPLNAIAKTVVPQDKDQAEAVREIVNIAGPNGIKLASVTFAASTLGGGPTTKNSGSLTQVLPVPNIAGVFQLPITIQQDSTQPITFAQFISFLTALENNRRTAQVSTINIQPTADRSKLSFTMQVNEYIKP